MGSRLQYLWWHLRHPRYYREFLRHVQRRFSDNRDDVLSGRMEAIRWCAENEVTASEAIFQITGWGNCPTLGVLFPDEIAAATALVDQPQVRMGGGHIDLIYHLAEYLQATRAVETGVGYGWSTLSFLLSLSKRPGSELVSTDMPPYVFEQAGHEVGRVVPPRLRGWWTLIPLPDREGLPKALELLPEIDICHYDSDKSLEGRRWAYPKLWKALRPGGILISDDIDDNLAFKQFCDQIGQSPLLVRMNRKFVGVAMKA